MDNRAQPYGSPGHGDGLESQGAHRRAPPGRRQVLHCSLFFKYCTFFALARPSRSSLSLGQPTTTESAAQHNTSSVCRRGFFVLFLIDPGSEVLMQRSVVCAYLHTRDGHTDRCILAAGFPSGEATKHSGGSGIATFRSCIASPLPLDCIVKRARLIENPVDLVRFLKVW